MPSKIKGNKLIKNADSKLISYQPLRAFLKGQVIAHRGAPRLAPENTLSGFKTVANMHANWVEFDTQPCASGEWVVIHDHTLERTTNGRGRVIETPYSLLKTLDAGSWFHSNFKGEKIPLLSEVLTLLAKLKLHPNIEIKFEQDAAVNDSNDEFQKEKALINFCTTLENHWSDSLLPPLVSSFDYHALLLLKKMQSTLPLGIITERITPIIFEQMQALKPFSLHCDYEHFTHETLIDLLTMPEIMPGNQHEYSSKISHLKMDTRDDRRNKPKEMATEFSLLLYTINNQKQARRYFDIGVDAIFSDIPNLLHPSTET